MSAEAGVDRLDGLDAWVARLVAVDDLAVGARVVVGCSGGADSLALLVLALARGFVVCGVYVDHGLRPEAGFEARVVQRAARRFGAAARTLPVEVAPGPNLEARARDARYAAFARAARDFEADAVLVGHTRDDQAETVLLNLLRGSALSGLAGMPLRRGDVRRPLLAMRRTETRELCARLALAPVRDPMNEAMHFRRVWLRREVIPALERGADRDLVEVLARQAELLRDDESLLDELAARSADAVDDVDRLLALAPPISRRVVRRWLGSPPPSSATVDRVLAVARGGARAAEVPGGRRVERTRGALALVPVDANDATAPPELVSLAVPGHARFGELVLEARVEHGPPAQWPDGRSVAVCDAARVGEALVVRAARPGERFRPLGRGGSKLVSDALAEAGVPASRRAGAPVVASLADNGVVWVVGYRVDDRVRVTTRTRNYLWLSAEPAER